jgi:hypothetical protein
MISVPCFTFRAGRDTRKTIMIRVLIVLLITPLCAAAQSVAVTKAQLDKDTWIANAKYNINMTGHYELVAIAAGLHDAFAADPEPTKEQGLAKQAGLNVLGFCYKNLRKFFREGDTDGAFED